MFDILRCWRYPAPEILRSWRYCDVGTVEVERCDAGDTEILKILSRVALCCVVWRALDGVWCGASRCVVCIAGARKARYDKLRLAWFAVCCFV